MGSVQPFPIVSPQEPMVTTLAMNTQILMKTLIITLSALGVILTAAACHTLHGAGHDVRDVGRGIEHAADAR